MKPLLIILAFFCTLENASAQNIFGNPRDLRIVDLVYAAKVTQDGTAGHVPTLTGEFNPYAIGVVMYYDSVGCCRVVVGPFAEEVNVDSEYLHPLIYCNSIYKTAKVWAVSSSQTVTVHTFVKQQANFTDNYSFTLFVYAIKKHND
jgi:hypothetical protein